MINTANGNIATLTGRVDALNQEVVQARNGEANLKTRIDNIATLAKENKTNITNLTTSNNDLKQEIIDARSGKNSLKEKIDEMVSATTQAKAVADRADAKSIQNETRINNILNSMISFRVI